MKIKYLGTAAAEGWPGIFCACQYCKEARRLGGKNIRTRSSVLINDDLMIDFPPDTYCHVINFELDLSTLRHLVITHSHSDHFHLNDLILRRSVFAHLYDESILEIYGNKAIEAIMTNILNTHTELQKYMNFNYIPPFETANVGDVKITPLLALHARNEDCYIYIFEDKDGKQMLYGNDTGIFPEETWEYIGRCYFHVVSLDCTSGPDREGTNHMGIPDNIKVKERMLQIGCADNATKFILTHFSHNGRLLHEELVELTKPHNFIIAYDGFEILI